jgi:hypothetical protein
VQVAPVIAVTGLPLTPKEGERFVAGPSNPNTRTVGGLHMLVQSNCKAALTSASSQAGACVHNAECISVSDRCCVPLLPLTPRRSCKLCSQWWAPPPGGPSRPSPTLPGGHTSGTCLGAQASCMPGSGWQVSPSILQQHLSVGNVLRSWVAYDVWQP